MPSSRKKPTGQESPGIDPDDVQAWWNALNAPDGPNVRRLRDLVRRGFDVNTGDPRGLGQTALHQAAQHGNADLVNRLLDLGADPNRYRTNGMAVLHDAAGITQRRGLEHARTIIDRLLAHGVPVDQPIGPGGIAHGASAMWLAAYNNQAVLVHHLIWRGAALDTVNIAGVTARTIAQEQGFDDVRDVLVTAERQVLARSIDDLRPSALRERPRL